jgi:hypothetical protein
VVAAVGSRPVSNIASFAALVTSRTFRNRLRLGGWLVFWLSCVSAIVLSENAQDLVLGPLLTGSLILTLAYTVAWLMRRRRKLFRRAGLYGHRLSVQLRLLDPLAL